MTLEDIKKNWLLGAESGYSDEELIKGFKSVSTFLNKDFIEQKWRGQRGIAVVNQIVGLGLGLASVSRIKGFDILKKRLLNNSTYAIAISELSNAIPFVDAKLLTELYPGNPDKNGELEMKLETKKGEAIFVEVVSPQTQVWNRFLLKLIDPIRKTISTMQDIRLEIYLYKELDHMEQKELIKICQDIASQGEINIERKYEGKYHIFLSNADTIKINSAEKKADDEVTLFVTNLTQANGHKNLVTLGVPFADKRAQQVLEGEYHQLTSSQPNIVVIDVAGVPNGMKNWPAYIKRRLQPNLNRKISAVILSSGENSKRMNSKYLLIINSHASRKIPSEVADLFQQ